MATLPGAADLGPAPRLAVYRPASVGGFDTSGLARGEQALARGGEQLGQGVARLGQDIGDVAAKEADWQSAQAHSEFLTNKISLDGATAKDTNPGPDAAGKSLPNRYAEQLWQQRDAAAAKITDPRAREQFLTQVAPTVAHGIVSAQSHAIGLQNNADIAYVQQQGDTTINKAVGASDDTTRMQLLDAHNRLIDGLQAKGAIDPTRALSMKQEWAHQYATADLLARADTDPQGVINELRAKPGSPAAITNRILQVEGTDKNGRSSATGAGQFIDSTWLDMIKAKRPDLAQGRSDADILSLRADRNLGREMTEAYRAQNEAYLKNQGVDSGPGAQYLAHFLGPGAAAAVLKADPKAPIADVLAKAVGPDKAQAMIAANPTVLQGQLSGSVKQWADGKMGGQAAGGGSIYDILRPDVREQVLAHAQTQLHKQTVEDVSGLHARVQDTTAEAMNTGTAKNPVSQAEFIQAYGAEKGTRAFADYQGELALGADVKRVASLSPAEQGALLDKYEPQPGAGYAGQSQRQAQLAKAIAQTQAEVKKDPADYAIKRLPASAEAWGKLSSTLADPTANDDDRHAAARDFATKTALEQSRIGVPSDAQRILPKSYLDSFNKAITTASGADDPQARIGLVARVQREAAVWGDSWPAVMRELAPGTQPIVRAIAAGADPAAMTRLLALPKDENPAKILKEQSEAKFSDLSKALNTEMAPFLGSLVGNQKDRDYPGYYGLAEKLTALSMRDGKSATDAAHDAFNALVGNRYDFKDTYRIPKSAGVSADDVQNGAHQARAEIAAAKPLQSSFDQAKADLSLTPQEQALYQRHLTNLVGPGGVDNPNGSRSTLFQMSFERDGKTYNVPTVWDGKILKPADAIKRAEREGLDKFPAYASEDEAEARYGKMHDYMEQDTARFLQGRKNPLADIKPAIDDIGLSDNRGDSLAKFGRDGVWVTAPDNSGLNLVYGDKFVRRQSDGKPLMLPWAELAARGKGDFKQSLQAAAPAPQ